jgi:hypothetical protein
MIATGTGHTVIDVRPAAPGGEVELTAALMIQAMHSRRPSRISAAPWNHASDTSDAIAGTAAMIAKTRTGLPKPGILEARRTKMPNAMTWAVPPAMKLAVRSAATVLSDASAAKAVSNHPRRLDSAMHATASSPHGVALRAAWT